LVHDNMLYMIFFLIIQSLMNRIKFKGDLIISSPDVSLVELGPDVEFVLVATDGLWDYIKR
jgi:protein phosphatase 1A